MVAKASGRAPGPLGRHARTWSAAHRAILFGTPLARLIRVRFEAMVKDPEATLQQVLDHMGAKVTADQCGRAAALLRSGTAGAGSSRARLSPMADCIVRTAAEAELAQLGYIASPGRPGLARRAGCRAVDEAWLRLHGLRQLAAR